MPALMCKRIGLFAAVWIPLLVTASPLTAQSEDESTVLARIGPHTITVQDYLERVDLMPWPGKDNPATRDSAKITALSSLVAEKLMSLQAVDQGISPPEASARALQSLERLLARDELYRAEILTQVTVTPQQIADGVERFAFLLTLNSYVMKTEQDAQQLAAALNAMNAGGNLVEPNIGIISHDTITIRFGNLKEAAEWRAFSIDSVGKAVAFNVPEEGWLVFQLLEKNANESYAKASGHERQTTVERIIRQRKEGASVVRYLRGIFTQNIMLDSAAFHLLADRLRAVMISDSTRRREQGEFVIVPEDVDSLKTKLAPVLKQPIGTMGDFSVSLEELIDELPYWPVRFTSLRRPAFLRTLNHSIQSLVEAGIISDEAINRQMNQRPGVRRDLRVWGDAIQADQMLRHLADSLGNVLNAGVTSEKTLDPSIDPALKASGMMNRYLAALAEKYGVEVYFDKLRNVQINPSNMVTKRFIGFGGTMMGAPMILRLWDWIQEWEVRRRSRP